jgi:hypothetical protein
MVKSSHSHIPADPGSAAAKSAVSNPGTRADAADGPSGRHRRRSLCTAVSKNFIRII